MAFHISVAVFWCLVACLLALAVAALRWWRTAVVERRRTATLERSLRARDEEARHLVETRLPAVAEAAYSRGVPIPGLLNGQLEGSPFGRNLESAAASFSGFVETAQSRADRAARASLASAMKALQGLANEQQLAISAMQERHDDPEVLQGLLEIDHMNAQIGRRAQAIAVLSGSWPGRQRSSSPVLAVVRGATSRIRDYQRVQIRGQVDLAVVSRAVEPAVLAVAELLDNAARHSQPDTPIEVSIQSAHNGVSIVIDDCGVGMLDAEMRQAAALLSGEQTVDVTRLGDPPAFGHAVVGRLAARYGFRAYADSASPFGGLRAVVFLPGALLTSVDKPAPVPAARPEPRRPRADRDLDLDPVPVAEATPAPTPPALPADDLPQRRRRQPAAEHARADAAAAPQAPEQRPAREDAATLGAFQRGTRAGRATTPSPDNQPDNQPGTRPDTPSETPEGPSESERQPQR
ncbi:ATP-binding protein [Peterkaempfera bronchialis]|uniref:ATP-binding protein n=1 Tax=Peterkaempfera bronchialis TaxID=2126346 RepID=UPI003C2FB476